MNLNYTYDESKVKVFNEGQTILTPLEVILLKEIDTLTERYEDLLESVPVVHTI